MKEETFVHARVKVREVGFSRFSVSKRSPATQVFESIKKVFVSCPEQLLFSVFTSKVKSQTIRPKTGDRLKIAYFARPETKELQTLINDVYREICSDDGGIMAAFASLQALKIITETKNGIVFFEQEDTTDILMAVLEEKIEGTLLNATFENEEGGGYVAFIDDEAELFSSYCRLFKGVESLDFDELEDDQVRKDFEKWHQNLLSLSERYLEKWNNPAEVALYRDALNSLPKEDYSHLQETVRQNVLDDKLIHPLDLILSSQDIQTLDTKVIC